MKHNLLILTSLLFSSTCFGQHFLSYQSYSKGVENGDTSFVSVNRVRDQLKINNIEHTVKNPIPGYAETITYVDYSKDSIYTWLKYPNESFYSSQAIDNEHIRFTNEGKERILGYDCTKYKTNINSNTIEVWMTDDLKFNAIPVANYACLKGVMVRCARNGNSITDLKEVKTQKAIPIDLIPFNMGQRKSGRELSQIRKDKLVLRIPVFHDEQIHFADYKPFCDEIPFDTTLHFCSGTLIVRRMNLQTLPEHYQLFAELHQRSNGDAYDRTASIFVIPTEKAHSFAHGLTQGLDALPIFKGRDGQEYQGIKAESDYLPPVELVRFFTSFGVGHFNDRLQIDGLTWLDENYYKQEITELADRLRGDVLIGAFIGNYDGGGHKLSLDIVAYPGDYEWNEEPIHSHSLPLFNTCNVMEMAGQNYGRLFLTDSLKIEFDIPEGAKNLRLRYISTGHGGWGGGDEFNPKENAIFIDGTKAFTYTPWRCDCATFRDQNPVSGNFWNGMSSSDYSRSGWCPGTATNPVYFDLNHLAPGHHTLHIAIPQGKDEGESFSHWMISGVLLYTL